MKSAQFPRRIASDSQHSSRESAGAIVLRSTSGIGHAKLGLHEFQRKVSRDSLFQVVGPTGCRIEKVGTFFRKLEDRPLGILHSGQAQLDNYVAAVAREPYLRNAVSKLDPQDGE